LSQKVDHRSADGFILTAEAFRTVEIDERSRANDLEMGRIRKRPVEIGSPDRFERLDRIRAIIR
jgi:hypothetical protein